MEMIVRVQAMVRGFLQRRKYQVQKMQAEVASKYFKAEEAAETLKGDYKEDAPLQQRSFTYRTGATYKGSWKGGLRHG
jgi:hypothetical protein